MSELAIFNKNIIRNLSKERGDNISLSDARWMNDGGYRWANSTVTWTNGSDKWSNSTVTWLNDGGTRWTNSTPYSWSNGSRWTNSSSDSGK